MSDRDTQSCSTNSLQPLRKLLFDQSMHSGVKIYPPNRHRLSRGSNTFMHTLLLLLLVTVIAMFVTPPWFPVAHALRFELVGDTINNNTVFAYGVDSVLLDGVSIGNSASVVFDIAAMLPGAVRIELRDCVCDGGSQIYVLGYNEDPASNRSLEVSVDRLSGRFCSLVLAHNLPPQTNVTIRDSTIVTTGPVSYAPVNGLTDAIAAPLVLYATALSQSQLRVENSVLRTSAAGGMALYVGGNVYLLSSAVVLDGVSLEASGGDGAYAMYVSPASVLSLQSLSVFSVTNTSVVSSGSGIVLGDSLTMSRSVFRLVRLNANIANPLLHAGGGTIGVDAWLDIYGVRVSAVAGAGESSSSLVASLSSVTLDGGVVSIVHSIASGATFATAPTVTSGIISVQCNRLGTKVLEDTNDYTAAGMLSVNVAPCFSCVENQRCFTALTSSFLPNNCTCSCSSGSFGRSCLPFDVPFAKLNSRPCITGITITESATLGFEDPSLCFNNVTLSGPITVIVDLRQMNTYVDSVYVTLSKCLLTGGAQLIINGLNSIEEWMPPLKVDMKEDTSNEATIVFQSQMPRKSRIILDKSELYATTDGSLYVPTTTGEEDKKYGPVLVLNNLWLFESQLVITETRFTCVGEMCSSILVEHNLNLQERTSFFLYGCLIYAQNHGMYFLASDLYVLSSSVLSLQLNKWYSYGVGALKSQQIVLRDRGVLHLYWNFFFVGYSIFTASNITIEKESLLSLRRCGCNTMLLFHVDDVKGNINVLDNSVWSLHRLTLAEGWYMANTVWATNDLYPVVSADSKVYGGNFWHLGTIMNDYSFVKVNTPVTVFPTFDCAKELYCYLPFTKSVTGSCVCVCTAGGYGPYCLPAPLDGIVFKPSFMTPKETVYCIRRQTLGNILMAETHVGFCFIDVNFNAPVAFVPASPVKPNYNITFLRCNFMGLRIMEGNTNYLITIDASVFQVPSTESAALTLKGAFKDGSTIIIKNNTITSLANSGILFDTNSIGTNSIVLLLNNKIVAVQNAILFNSNYTVDGSSFVVQNSTLKTSSMIDETYAALKTLQLSVVNGGYFDFSGNTLDTVSGVMLSDALQVSKNGLFRVAGCSFLGTSGYAKSSLLFLSVSAALADGSQWRMERNNVNAGYIIYNTGSSIVLTGGGTTAVISSNTQAK
ncbi:dispersed protein family protein 1 (DGF-1), partial [Trypanosoma theileri]